MHIILPRATDRLESQALSKRIHYGKFVAEAKFVAQTEEYTQLILAKVRLHSHP